MHGWAGVPGFVRRHSGDPGWALVGDAGYFKDPITTHGITDALRDAELLADAILEVLAGAVPEAVALARYQATRDRLSSGLFDATEGSRRTRWDLREIRALLREVSSAMSDEVDLLQARPHRARERDARPCFRPTGLPRNVTPEGKGRGAMTVTVRVARRVRRGRGRCPGRTGGLVAPPARPRWSSSWPWRQAGDCTASG